jgi:hypothetical protein
MTNIPDDELYNHIIHFLEDFKNLVLERKYFVKNHIKNKEALIDLGLTANQREEILLSLSADDYCQGPKPDTLNSGVYWVFGKKIDGAEVYIKLKIVEAAREEYAICLSFHKSESPLRYPFA